MDVEEESDESDNILMKVFDPHILGIFFFKSKKTNKGYKYKPYLFAHSYKDIIMLEEPFIEPVTEKLDHSFLNELLRLQICKASDVFEEARNLGFLFLRKNKGKKDNEDTSVSVEK